MYRGNSPHSNNITTRFVNTKETGRLQILVSFFTPHTFS